MKIRISNVWLSHETRLAGTDKERRHCIRSLVGAKFVEGFKKPTKESSLKLRERESASPYRHHPLLLLQPRGRTRGGRSARPSPPRSLFGFCCSFVAVLPAPPSVPSAAAAAAAFFPPVSVAPTARAASPMGAPLCFLRLRGCSVPLLPHRSRRKTPLERRRRRRKTLQCSLPPRLTLRRPLFPSERGCQMSIGVILCQIEIFKQQR